MKLSGARGWLFAFVLGAAFVHSAMSQAVETDRANTTRGEQAYLSSCAQCHGPARSMKTRIQADKRMDQAWLDAFLSDHYAEDEELRADLIVFLIQG